MELLLGIDGLGHEHEQHVLGPSGEHFRGADLNLLDCPTLWAVCHMPDAIATSLAHVSTMFK